jgi:ribosomal-protein-alanine N-acetyltransferase
MELALQSDRLLLGLPQPDLAQGTLDFHRRNHHHLARWSPPTPPGFDTLEFWQDYVEKSHIGFLQGNVVRLWVREKSQPDRVIGTVGFSQIFRGPFCNCVLGYQIDEALQGRGIMREALACAIDYMFRDQKIHRINANYRPENVRSGKLLARLGFQIDGYAREYLFIDGEWRDHVQTSLLNRAFQREWLSVR